MVVGGMDSADDTRSVSATASNLNRGTARAIRGSLALSRGFRPLFVNMIRKLISPDIRLRVKILRIQLLSNDDLPCVRQPAPLDVPCLGHLYRFSGEADSGPCVVVGIQLGDYDFASADSRSASMSDADSIPQDSRIRPLRIPRTACSSPVRERWEVLAGWEMVV